MARMLPDYTANPHAAGLINERHLERVVGYVEDARARGARVVELSGRGVNRAARKLAFTLVIDPGEDTALMGNEIFGPVLPVKPYRALEEVIEYINARERPLGLYVYGRDARLVERVLKGTIAGGVSINTAAVHAAVPSLPFGGIGMSGMGRHHGFEGFLAFSHQKSVFRSGLGFMPSLLYPPYGRTLDRILDWILK
jgi:coniferyl-aldehyde dehydrogenase